MKKILIPLLLFTFNLHAQKKGKVNLEWKIADTVTYHTVMNDSRPENPKMPELNKKDSFSQRMMELYKNLQSQTSDLEYETKLYPDKRGNVDIEMVKKSKKVDTSNSWTSRLSKMSGNVVLRGKVSSEGELLSSFYKRAQTNLISLLFELPVQPVKVGDEWSLNVNLLSMDQSFKADSILKRNRASLKEIKRENGADIAVIEYDFLEYVSGDWTNGMLKMKANTPGETIFFRASHKALGQFDLNKGCWSLYKGTMIIETNVAFFGLGNKTTEFELVPKK